MAAQLSDQVNKTSGESIIRRTAEFHPNIWGDYFLRYGSHSSVVDVATTEHFQQLKEEVKMMLSRSNKDVNKTLELVDTIQRLGFSYHFDEEISDIIRNIKGLCGDEVPNGHSLHIASLQFRLLRQEGYDISSDKIFKKFTNEDREFKDELATDVQGLLSLYEASHFMCNGEPILEEALTFTTNHLQSLVATSSNISEFLVMQVKHALERPIRKGVPRMEARKFISVYQEDPLRNDVLLKFWKLDFNIVQKLHQQELCELTSWWIELDLESKLPYFRDRLVECYLWMMGINFMPEFSNGRKILTKIIQILTVVDDTYDVHGTITELRLLTKAMHSGDIECLEQIPFYMKCIYKSMLDLYEEIGELMEKEGKGSYRVQYAKQVVKDFFQAYLQEAEWFSKKYVPTMEEYMENGLVTSGQCLFAIISFLGMGDIATEDAFEWVSKYPKIICAGGLVTRLMDDAVTHKFEQKRGHVASSVECYMKQYGVSEEEAYTELRRRVKEAWKDINEEFVEPRAIPMPLLLVTVNYTRSVDVFYKDKDIFTQARGLMKELVKSMFVDSIPM